jgi:hypothetical protein
MKQFGQCKVPDLVFQGVSLKHLLVDAEHLFGHWHDACELRELGGKLYAESIDGGFVPLTHMNHALFEDMHHLITGLDGIVDLSVL